MPHLNRRTRRGLTAFGAIAALAAAGLLGSPSSSADLRDDVAAAEAQLHDLEMQAASAHGRVEEAQYNLELLKQKMGKTQSKVEGAKAQLAETQSNIGKYAATAYRSGGIDSSLQLLLADNPQEFLDQAVVLDIVASGQSAALRKTQAARLGLAQATAELAQQDQAQQAALADLQQREEEFNSAAAEADNYLAGLKEELRQQILAEQARKAAEAKAAAAAALAAQQASANGGGGGSGNPNPETTGNGDPASGGAGGTDPSSTDASGGAGGNSGGDGGYSGGSGVSSDRAAIAVAYALAQVGKPYSYAAQPPDSWDCTKLTAAAWAQAGVQLTAYSFTQAQEVRRISPDELQPGDLLFFLKNGAHHASMYIGGGQIVEASSPEVGVRITDVWNSWNVTYFSWAGRPYG